MVHFGLRSILVLFKKAKIGQDGVLLNSYYETIKQTNRQDQPDQHEKLAQKRNHGKQKRQADNPDNLLNFLIGMLFFIYGAFSPDRISVQSFC